MAKHIYQQRMVLLLEDNNIYEKINEHRVVEETRKYNNETKKLIKNEDSSCLKTSEHRPKTAILYAGPAEVTGNLDSDPGHHQCRGYHQADMSCVWVWFGLIMF